MGTDRHNVLCGEIEYRITVEYQDKAILASVDDWRSSGSWAEKTVVGRLLAAGSDDLNQATMGTLEDNFDDIPTNLAKPLTSATITVRVVKSLEYRVAKALVLHNVDLEHATVGQLKTKIREAIGAQAGWKPYRTIAFDTLKLYTKAHGSKTSNLIINLDHDEYMLSDDNATLASCGMENETEVSFFNGASYEAFKASPEVKWD